MKLFKYLRWRLLHNHEWKKQGDGAYSCEATHLGTVCGAWYGEQLWI